MLITLANINNVLCLNTALATILYAIIGAIMLMGAYKVFDIINPLDFDKEIANNNTALSIMLAGFFIGVAIVIAAAIFG